MQIFAVVLVVLGCGLAGADVRTQHYDNARTGATLTETALTAATVIPGKFGKKWTLYADGQVVAQPLYVERLAIDAPGVQGTFNAVIVATMHNTVYVYDADAEKRGADGRTAPLWAKWLGEPRPGTKQIDMWSTNDPEWGILSTPVVSEDRKTLYAVAWHNDGAAGLQYRLHALALQDGADVVAPVAVGPASTDASQPCNQGPFNPCKHKQRAALLLHQGLIYIAFGGDGNKGAMFVFDAATLTQRAFWSSTPTGTDGGIWQSGQGPAADEEGHVYLMTGNGAFNGNTGGQNFGNSFVKLKVEGAAVTVKDYFTPCNFQFLNDKDLDLGSSGPVLLPTNPPLVTGGGKEGVLYLLSRAQLGKYAASPEAPACKNANALQEFRAFETHVHGGAEHYGNIHGSPVYWKGPDAERIYAWGENSTLNAYVFKQGRYQDVANPRKSAYRPPAGMPGGMLSISANGNKAGSGILWAAVPLDGDANTNRGVKGILLALDAQDVSRTLWTSEQFAERDRLGLFANFVPPVVAGGKVFMATYGDDDVRRKYDGANRPAQFPARYGVAVYGLLGPPMTMPAVVNKNSGDVAVVRATTEPLALDRTRCAVVEGGMNDCTAALQDAAGGAPSLHSFVVSAANELAGCVLVRVTVASKDAGLNAASGVGFWAANAAGGNQAAGNTGLFVGKARLKTVGTGTLLNGSGATLHEFAGVVNCATGDGESLSLLFKPYMEFLGADGKRYRNWDMGANYRLAADVTEFDRRGDVLRP